jgi:hypothetical protein
MAPTTASTAAAMTTSAAAMWRTDMSHSLHESL